MLRRAFSKALLNAEIKTNVIHGLECTVKVCPSSGTCVCTQLRFVARPKYLEALLMHLVGLLILAAVTLSACSQPYPTQCPKMPPKDLNFLRDRVTEDRTPDGLVKTIDYDVELDIRAVFHFLDVASLCFQLTFQFLPRQTIDYAVELDIRAVFHFLDVAEGSDIADPICAGLASVHFVKKEDGFSVEKLEYSDVNMRNTFLGVRFLENFDEFELKALFDPSVDVGLVHINKTCWEKERTYSTCVEMLKVGEELELAFSQKNPFSEEFWHSVDYLHGSLGARLEKLHVTFPDHSENVIFRFFMWKLDQAHVEICDFRMSSTDYYPDWGPLNTSWIQIMPLLSRLDLGNNGISELQPDYLTAVTKTLTYLNLGRNKLSTIPPEIYNLTKLTFLDLSRNPFHNVDSFFDVDHLKSFQHVTFFNMSHVSIKNMTHIASVLKQGDADMKPMNLTVLDLSFCDLKDFHKHPELFAEQRKLTHLFLAGNRMVNSPRLHFGDEQQLFTIDLTFNNLTTPVHILDVGSVTNLNMSFNNITSWTVHSDYLDRNLSLFNNIENLNLSFNTIPILTEEMGLSLEELKTVDLGGNPIDCRNCNISQFKKWLKSYQISNNTNLVNFTLFNIVVDDFNCTTPLALNTTLVSDVNATIIEMLCREDHNNFMQLGVAVSVVSSMLMLMGVILFVYRHEAKYILHLVKTKKRMKASAILAEGDYIFDTFVCYSGHDRAWVVGNLLPTLQNGPEKYRLCLHEFNSIFENVNVVDIKDAVKNSRHVIVVISGNFVKNQWCKWELEMANHKLFEESREFLVLIELERLDRSILPRYLKYLMDTRTYLEWPEPGDRTGEVEVVYSRLKEALGPSIHEMMQEQMQGEEICTVQDIPLRETKA